MWPPPPTDSENHVPKIDTRVEITANNVSSIISSFSALSEEQSYTSHAPAREITRGQTAVEVPLVMDVDLQPEPAPEYGIITDSEPHTIQEVQPEPQHEEPHVTVEDTLVPEPQPVFEVMPSETPAFLDSELQMMEEYQRIPAPTLETHKAFLQSQQ